MSNSEKFVFLLKNESKLLAKYIYEAWNIRKSELMVRNKNIIIIVSAYVSLIYLALLLLFFAYFLMYQPSHVVLCYV